MTPADAAAVERAQRVQARPADATPEVAAGLAADVLALAAALRKLRWCVQQHTSDAAVDLVAPAAIERCALAHGWRETRRDERSATLVRGAEVVYVLHRGDPRDVRHCARYAVADLSSGTGLAFELVLCELLPAAGPWDDGGSDG